VNSRALIAAALAYTAVAAYRAYRINETATGAIVGITSSLGIGGGALSNFSGYLATDLANPDVYKLGAAAVGYFIGARF